MRYIVRTLLIKIDGAEEIELACDESEDYARVEHAEDEFVGRTGGISVEDCAVCDIPELGITLEDEEGDEGEEEDEEEEEQQPA